jgi:hypothetical protein
MSNQEINDIFKNNELSDLKTFIIQRDNLNKTNLVFMYSYHIINTSAIIITTIATYYNYKPVLICGITINIFGQLLNTIVHLNNSISDKIYADILKIKNNKYYDMSNLVNSNDLNPVLSNLNQNNV